MKSYLSYTYDGYNYFTVNCKYATLEDGSYAVWYSMTQYCKDGIIASGYFKAYDCNDKQIAYREWFHIYGE